MSTIIRRRRNRIDGMNDLDGSWISDKEDLKNNAVKYFMELFKEDEGSCIPPDWPNLFLEGVANNLDSIISEEDVKQAVFQ